MSTFRLPTAALIALAASSGCQAYDRTRITDAGRDRADSTVPTPTPDALARDARHESGESVDAELTPADDSVAEPTTDGSPPVLDAAEDAVATPDTSVTGIDAQPDVQAADTAMPPVDAAVDAALPSLIANGSFESATLAPWSLVVQPTVAATLARDTAAMAPHGAVAARVTVTQASTTMTWHVQLKHGNLALQAGRTYTLTFWSRASATRMISFDVQRAASPYDSYSFANVTLTTAWQRFTATFTAPVSTSAMLSFNCAAQTGDIWFDQVSLSP